MSDTHAYRVDGEGMLPALKPGQQIVAETFSHQVEPLSRGDIILFRAAPASQPDNVFIKRVIGLPGEKVQVKSGIGVFINGKRLNETYITETPDYAFGPDTVPANAYFVLGDNRNNSYDSAKWLTSPWLERKHIIGKVTSSF